MRGLGGLMDRYAGRRFIGAYGVCLAAFALLFVVIDFFSRLDEFIDSADAVARQGGTIWAVVGRFYLTDLPTIFVTLAPFMTLFAAIVTIVGLARTNELTAMVASGRSVHRALLPLYGIALLLAVLHGVTLEYVVPLASREHQQIKRMVKEEGEVVDTGIGHLRDDHNVFSAERWLPVDQVLEQVESKGFKDPDGRLREGTLTADRLLWRSHQGVVGWYPRGGQLLPSAPDPDGRPPLPIPLDLEVPVRLDLSPGEIDLTASSRKSDPSAFSRGELHQLIERFPERSPMLSLELHSRLARPLAGLVMLVLAIPFISAAGHRSVAAGLGVALGGCIAYLAAELLCTELGRQGHLHPLVAAWLTPCFYGAAALARLDKTPT